MNIHQRLSSLAVAASLVLVGCEKKQETAAPLLSDSLPKIERLSESESVSVLIYSIKKGDTLSEIAKKHNVSLGDLKEANNLDNVNQIEIGQKIKIYGAESKLNPPTEKSKPQIVVYTIKKGDALGAIAKRFKVSLAELQRTNGIKNVNDIKINQKLKIYLSGTNSNLNQKASDKTTNNPPKEQRIAEINSLKKGSVPILSVKFMPNEAREHSRKLGNLVRGYAIDQKLGLMGPPLCGMGVCNAFDSVKIKLTI